MSYCRWSSDNWKCDLYCYEDVAGGYTTHVADNRIIGTVPEAPLEWLLGNRKDEWAEAHRKEMAYLDTAKREPIGLPYDGESFNDATLEEFKARLVMLREAGYHFPDYVFTQVEDEIKEQTSVEASHD